MYLALLRRLLPGCLATSLLVSCASVSVKKVSETNGREKAPSVIVVEPFSTVGVQVKENQFRQHPGKLASETQLLVQGYLVSELNKAGIAAETASSPKIPRTSAWVIEGRITRVAEGSRLLRMGIGLGMGGTKLETQVQVKKSGAGKAFLSFNTTGGSNATPGAATNPIPFSSAPTALIDSKDGVTDDSARTARMITGTIANYLVKHGLLKSTTAPAPKLATQ
ncbi:MAG: DUF4410 domain-containing protein [Chthoniobacteraceae bacterium]